MLAEENVTMEYTDDYQWVRLKGSQHWFRFNDVDREYNRRGLSGVRSLFRLLAELTEAKEPRA